MIRFLLLVLALASGSAGAQAQPQQPQERSAPAPPRTYSQADIWDRGNDRISFRLGNVSFPTVLGTTRLNRIVEASHEGQGLDNALLYYSPDEQVFVTVYAYAPALPDAGLTAFMTDYAIHLTSGSALRVLRSGLVAAGGRDGVAIRIDYAGARDQRLASSAAFLRVGRWIIKLRVSGPEARRAEVEQAMAALLAGLRFDGRALPGSPLPVAASDCPRDPARAARPMLSDDSETAADAIMAHVVVEVEEGLAQTGRPVRLQGAPHWCRTEGFRMANTMGPTPVLRDLTPRPEGEMDRRVLVALLADNGTMLEVVERRLHERTRFVLVHHQIGRTMVLGAYDGIPTDAQLAAIMSGEDREGGRARAVIDYEAGGDSRISISTGPPPPRT